MKPRRSEAVPAWLSRLGVASWTCDAEHTITHANLLAEALLGRAQGRRCHEAVHGVDRAGDPFCREHCPVRQQLAAGHPVEPVRVRVGAGEKWVDLLSIPLAEWGEAGPVVHLAVDADGEQGARDYLERIASRYRPLERVRYVEQCGLTPRERDILGHLAEDKDPQAIARELGVSPTTVRNHVQRVLAKLDVHSIQEAVAVFLLGTR